MTCQNLQNKLLNITVLFIWYLLQIVGEFKKNVTRQTWQALFHFGEYLFQSTRHFGECLKNMVSHTEMIHWFQRRRCLKHLNGGDLDIIYFCEQRGNDPSNKV